jgi:hypothetical protein
MPTREGQWRVLIKLVLPVCALLSTGCGQGSSDTVHLAGTVTLGGKPLPSNAQGTIVFKPASADSASASAPIVDGQYNSPLTPTGAVKVFFNITKPSGRTFKSSRTGETVNEVQSLVPASQAAGLDLKVETDNSSQNFDLAAQ